MKLYTREFGGRGIPVAILHGLFASSKNWIGTAQYLSEFCKPFALDQRNHGDSPHSDSHTFEGMISDLDQWLNLRLFLSICRPTKIGGKSTRLLRRSYRICRCGSFYR